MGKMEDVVLPNDGTWQEIPLGENNFIYVAEIKFANARIRIGSTSESKGVLMKKGKHTYDSNETIFLKSMLGKTKATAVIVKGYNEARDALTRQRNLQFVGLT